MGLLSSLGGGGLSQGNGSPLRVADATERLALTTPYNGLVYQIDTDTLYSWSTITSAWLIVNSTAGAFTING